MFSKYNGLIFDMDGTLFDTEPLHRLAWKKVFAAENIEVAEAEFIKYNGSAPWMVAKQVIESRDLTLDPYYLSDRKRAAVEDLLIRELFSSLPALKILDEWKGQKPLALGTGSERSTVDIILDRFGLTDTFDVIVSADRVINHKPAADTFLLCASELNLAPETCLVFEDSLFGFAAAKSAGMDVIDVNNYLRVQG